MFEVRQMVASATRLPDVCLRPVIGSQELAHTRSRSGCSAASLHARLQGFEADSLPLHWRQSVEDTDVPSCALFDHPCPVGPPPGARWGHASAAVGDCLFLFGGDGPSMYSDGFVYNTGETSCEQIVYKDDRVCKYEAFSSKPNDASKSPQAVSDPRSAHQEHACACSSNQAKGKAMSAQSRTGGLNSTCRQASRRRPCRPCLGMLPVLSDPRSSSMEGGRGARFGSISGGCIFMTQVL